MITVAEESTTCVPFNFILSHWVYIYIVNPFTELYCSCFLAEACTCCPASEPIDDCLWQDRAIGNDQQTSSDTRFLITVCIQDMTTDESFTACLCCDSITL